MKRVYAACAGKPPDPGARIDPEVDPELVQLVSKPLGVVFVTQNANGLVRLFGFFLGPSDFYLDDASRARG
jgi:hypothetical protein